MPTYSYKCETCGGEFDAVQSIKDPPLDECPTKTDTGGCKGHPKRLISRTTFVLNGGGWAKDGYG